MTKEEAYNRIDAIIAKHEIDDEYVTITSAKDYDALRMARKVLEQEPKKGHWIKTISENGITSAVRCSECGFEDNRYMLFRYCPNCGCHMVEPQIRSE